MDDQTKVTDNAGHRLRVRERFKKSLGSDMADYELLEFILTYSIPRRDVKPVAKALLRRFGNLGEILSASPEELSKINWVKDSTILLLKGIGAVWQRISRLKLEENLHIALLTPDAVIDYCYTNMAFADVEEMRVMYFDAAQQYIDDELLWKGTIDQVTAYPREIVRHCLNHKASRIILVHNHPSDNLEPSKEDISLTQKIKEACQNFNIAVDDHIIIGKSGYYSFRSQKLI